MNKFFKRFDRKINKIRFKTIVRNFLFKIVKRLDENIEKDFKSLYLDLFGSESESFEQMEERLTKEINNDSSL